MQPAKKSRGLLPFPTVLNISIPAGDCRPGIYLPNAFSPNDDGRSDFFQPYGPDIELAELQVFSRWGSLL